MSDVPVKAWHWLENFGKMQYGDNRKVVVGKRLKWDDSEYVKRYGKNHSFQPILCQRGMHASIRPLDAYTYAPGNILCRVEMSGLIEYGSDKLVAEYRKVLWWIDATPSLVALAIWGLEEAIEAKTIRPTKKVLAYMAEAKARHRRGWPNISDDQFKEIGRALDNVTSNNLNGWAALAGGRPGDIVHILTLHTQSDLNAKLLELVSQQLIA